MAADDESERDRDPRCRLSGAFSARGKTKTGGQKAMGFEHALCQDFASQKQELRAHRRVIVCIISLLIMMGVLVGCADLHPPRVVKIGLIAPFEGPSRPYGYAILAAVKLRLQAWNEGGGRPQVELVALNDDGDPELAAALAAQLALDPDVLIVLGPAQSHTARRAAPALAAEGLPVLSLAPLPEAPWLWVEPLAGTTVDLTATLAPWVPNAIPAWEPPLAGPVIWLGDALTLAELRQTDPEQVPAAGPVAAEEAAIAWAGEALTGLIWATVLPDELPTDFVTAYEQRTGTPPPPQALLAYAATDQALRLLARAETRSQVLAGFGDLPHWSYHVFVHQGRLCCTRSVSTPP